MQLMVMIAVARALGTVHDGSGGIRRRVCTETVLVLYNKVYNMVKFEKYWRDSISQYFTAFKFHSISQSLPLTGVYKSMGHYPSFFFSIGAPNFFFRHTNLMTRALT